MLTEIDIMDQLDFTRPTESVNERLLMVWLLGVLLEKF